MEDDLVSNIPSCWVFDKATQSIVNHCVKKLSHGRGGFIHMKDLQEHVLREAMENIRRPVIGKHMALYCDPHTGETIHLIVVTDTSSDLVLCSNCQPHVWSVIGYVCAVQLISSMLEMLEIESGITNSMEIQIT